MELRAVQVDGDGSDVGVVVGEVEIRAGAVQDLLLFHAPPGLGPRRAELQLGTSALRGLPQREVPGLKLGADGQVEAKLQLRLWIHFWLFLGGLPLAGLQLGQAQCTVPSLGVVSEKLAQVVRSGGAHDLVDLLRVRVRQQAVRAGLAAIFGTVAGGHDLIGRG